MMSLGFIPWFLSVILRTKKTQGGPPRRVCEKKFLPVLLFCNVDTLRANKTNRKCIVGVLNVVAKKAYTWTSRIVPAFRHCSHAARSESSISWATPTSLVTADGKTLLLWVLVRDITDILCRRWNPSLIWWHGMSAQSSSMLSMPAVLAKTTQCR